MLNTAVIVIGGDPVPPNALDELPADRWVIAADSGLDHATRIGLAVDFVVGDMDSVDPSQLQRHAGPVDRHSPDKDATDFELALDQAIDRPNIDRIIVLGGHGGRLDHLLANAAVIASDRYREVEVEWVPGDSRVVVVRSHATLHGVPGQVVSLLPVGGDAIGVVTHGLRWELVAEDLTFGTTRGVSNEFSRPVATVDLAGGCLLAIVPETS